MLARMLRWFDETDLAAAVAPKPLLICGTRDKYGRPIPARRMEAIYKEARSRYKALCRESAPRLATGPCGLRTLTEWLRWVQRTEQALD